MLSVEFVHVSEYLLQYFGTSNSKNYLISHAHSCNWRHFSFKQFHQNLTFVEPKWTLFHHSQECHNICAEGSKGIRTCKTNSLRLVIALLAAHHYRLVHFEGEVCQYDIEGIA